VTVIWTKPSFSVRIEQSDVGSSAASYKNSVTSLFVFEFALGGGAGMIDFFINRSFRSGQHGRAWLL